MLAFVIYIQCILCLCINQGESHVSHVIICFELMLAFGNTRVILKAICLVVSPTFISLFI
jgi:hypothetical protein